MKAYIILGIPWPETQEEEMFILPSTDALDNIFYKSLRKDVKKKKVLLNWQV